MRKPRGPWYATVWFVRLAQLLGIAEMTGGLVLVVTKHDEAQGYALLAIGAATIGSTPWVSRARTD